MQPKSHGEATASHTSHASDRITLDTPSISALPEVPSPSTIYDALGDIIRPSIHTIGIEHEWALAIFDMIVVFADFHACHDTESSWDPDPYSTKIVAIEILCELPAWRLHWNDDSAAFDEICRQLRFQLTILGRVLLFIARQVPDVSRAHVLLSGLHAALFSLEPAEYMPPRFSSSHHVCLWTQQWIRYPLLNIAAAEAEKILTSANSQQVSGIILDHHPARNIWLFDQYLTPIEHATITALKARVWRMTQSPLLQLCAQSQTERLLTRVPNLPGSTVDMLLPSVAAWFMHAYGAQSTPETMLRGWYDLCMAPVADENAAPIGARYAWLPSQEAKWWVFFKRRLIEVCDREDIALVTKQYASRALQKMNWLDGSSKVGFGPQMKLRVESTRKPPTKL